MDLFIYLLIHFVIHLVYSFINSVHSFIRTCRFTYPKTCYDYVVYKWQTYKDGMKFFVSHRSDLSDSYIVMFYAIYFEIIDYRKHCFVYCVHTATLSYIKFMEFAKVTHFKLKKWNLIKVGGLKNGPILIENLLNFLGGTLYFVAWRGVFYTLIPFEMKSWLCHWKENGAR